MAEPHTEAWEDYENLCAERDELRSENERLKDELAEWLHPEIGERAQMMEHIAELEAEREIYRPCIAQLEKAEAERDDAAGREADVVAVVPVTLSIMGQAVCVDVPREVTDRWERRLIRERECYPQKLCVEGRTLCLMDATEHVSKVLWADTPIEEERL